MSTKQQAPATTITWRHVLMVAIVALTSALFGLKIGLYQAHGPVASNPTVPTQTTSQMMGDAENAHIYFLLDRSGSMQSIASDVIGGFNTFVQEQAAEPGKLTMTLIQFDSDHPHEVVFSGKDISDVPALTAQTFQPRARTPLYDALGNTMKMAEAANVPNERIVVVTFSDGQENASREHSREAIFNQINTKRAAGWTFVFLGANQDSYASGSGMGYSDHNTQNFAFDSAGVRAAYDSLSHSTKRSRVEMSYNMYDSEDFFKGEKGADVDYNSRSFR